MKCDSIAAWRVAVQWLRAWVWLSTLLPAAASLAETRVELLGTEPPGETVTLGPNQNFYLRIGYSADAPVRIWARPFWQGREVSAGSHPSRTYSGDGEALAWFFFLGEPGQQVDEIRVSAGDGSTAGTELLASWPLRITNGSATRPAAAEPDWLRRLLAEDERLAREEYEQRMSTPVGAGGLLVFGGFMIAVLALGVAGIAAPVWAMWRWRGGWRLAAAVPAAIVAFVALRILFGTLLDPTSHNLWPFEILQASVLALALMGVLFVFRKLAGGTLERQ